ncbi:class I SAM-dependent methyltransferase [Streptomyces halobius]|uniref:Class I SAM-dependent methyltransferase n=1 Tax=Streptomyces halobius TaxID=2879846 RepID=A0ABY4MHK4_9ACTN|nr:class I SAM-dependent methyltransferase [Streptomyces halobius]UQA97284.1 class I SAM-dependent methyltransferase [Streptomyces halobius]
MTDSKDFSEGIVAAGNKQQWQAWNGDEGQHWTQEWDRLEARYRHLTPHLMNAVPLDATSRVLDIGCGNGGTSLAAARIACDGSVLGVDLSGPMLDTARQRAADAGQKNVSFEQADAQVHPFTAEGFDVALSRFGVMFFADPKAEFANVAHGLRPGGQLAFLCWRDLLENEYLTVPFGAIAEHVPLPEPADPDAPGPFSLAAPERIRELLTGAGFDEVAISAVDERMRTGADADDAVAYFLGTPMGQSMIAAADAEARLKARAALRGAMAEHQRPDGVMLGSAAWLVTARRW